MDQIAPFKEIRIKNYFQYFFYFEILDKIILSVKHLKKFKVAYLRPPDLIFLNIYIKNRK